MVQSINMASNSSLGISVSTTAKKSENEKSAQTSAASSGASAPPPAAKSDAEKSVTKSEQGDVLELSSEGVAQAKTVVQEAAASVVAGSTSSSSSVNSSDLSKYSETELKDLVKKGTITTAQMNAELVERAKKEKTESESDSSTAK